MLSRGNIGINDIIGVNPKPNTSLDKLYHNIAILLILYDYTTKLNEYKVINMNEVFDVFLTNF